MKNNKTLKIIPSSPQPLAGIEVSKYEDLINKAKDEGHTITSISYFHGVLEKAMHYDIGLCLNSEVCIEDVNSDDLKYIEGIYDATVEDYPNICKAYLWNSGDITRGLIVDSTYKEDNEFAMKKFNEKSRRL